MYIHIFLYSFELNTVKQQSFEFFYNTFKNFNFQFDSMFIDESKNVMEKEQEL